jgi:hypothetical protein
MFKKERANNDLNSPFERKRRKKEVKEDPNLVANGRFHYLVTLERFHCLMALGRFHCLVAFERFHCLVTNGRRRKNTFPPLPTFPPTNFT